MFHDRCSNYLGAKDSSRFHFYALLMGTIKVSIDQDNRQCDSGRKSIGGYMNIDLWENPIALDGIEFVEYTSPNPEQLEQLFINLGFKKVGQHKTKDVGLFRQGGVNFIVNKEQKSFAKNFQKLHGPSICAMGWRTKLRAEEAVKKACQRGARKYEGKDGDAGYFPAIYGIGDMVIYFIDKYGKNSIYEDDFNFIGTEKNRGYGFICVDHLTNNVGVGKMDEWKQFYEKVFNFRDVRFFDIRGEKTGLVSKVMSSPCGKITIPINEPTDAKSQIQEYLDEYHGEGIQHLALLTQDIEQTLREMRKSGIEFLDAPDTYYEMLPKRVDQFTEDLGVLRELKVLVDGDDRGYILQIFTKNLIGPIFFEIIQRKNHSGFGEGNFQALFDAIERDQKKRGVL